MDALTRTDLPLPGRRQGKVRDLYDLPLDAMRARFGETPLILVVATDRLSAFDVVMPTPVPGKGRILTDMSVRWFDFIRAKGLAEPHLVSTDPDDIPGLNPSERGALVGRIMIARRCRVVPVECVARGYLDGSGWLDYQRNGSVCGVSLPPGLRRGDRLPEPIFTPATKEAVGTHDENIDFERACAVAGRDTMERLRAVTLRIYREAHAFALGRGLLLADTKFEFGFPVDERGAPTSDEPILVDEALTPDSSRYWEAAAWAPGGEQPSFDKQFVREYLNRLTAEGKWDKRPPGPPLPPEVIEGTLGRYQAVRDRLFG